MSLNNLHIWTLVALLAILGAMACGNGNDTEEDTGSAIDTDTDTGPVVPPCPPDFELNPTDYTGVYPAYDASPAGYGFQGSACEYVTNGVVTYDWVEGETMHDIRLNNDTDNEVAVSDYLGTTEYDLIFVDFSAVWCPPCKEAAAAEQQFIEIMAENGWIVEWITVLVDGNEFQQSTPQAPTRESAYYWKYLRWEPDLYNVEGKYVHGPVLYDANMEWWDLASGDRWPLDNQRNFPTIFIVHPSNMRVWKVVPGFAPPANPASFNNFITTQFLDPINQFKEEEGACTNPPCNAVGRLLVDTDN